MEKVEPIFETDAHWQIIIRASDVAFGERFEQPGLKTVTAVGRATPFGSQ